MAQKGENSQERWEFVASSAHAFATLHSPAFFVVLALLLATFLRFYHLDASSLWNDEGNSRAMVARSYADIAAAAAADIHPPGYYWLLKTWSLIFGASAWAVRSLSATLGVLLVALVLAMGGKAARGQRGWSYLPVLAAGLAALNPFQIYFSQEARMYMLLAVESAILFWALLTMMADEVPPYVGLPSNRLRALAPFLAYAVAGAAGLWTHYSFPIVLVAAGGAYLIWWLAGRVTASPTQPAPRRPGRLLARFIGVNLTVIALFLPWLPTAVTSVQSWPKGGEVVGLIEGIVLTLRTLLFGPITVVLEPLWPWLAVAGALPLLGLLSLRHRSAMSLAIGLWLLLPIGMMAVLGLFTDAFLKFLLLASPSWCLLAAAAPWSLGATESARRLTVVLAALLVIGAAAAAWLVLPLYYQDDTARDNYRGVAHYLAAMGDPTRDLVVLDAPGQLEVWRYYDPGVPVLALPAQRPPDRAATEATLAASTAGKRMIYALFWATDEADPDSIVERWLDQHAFKAFDTWQGNLRFVAYAGGSDLAVQPLAPVAWQNGMILDSVSLPAQVSPLRGGDVALVQLNWAAPQPIDRRYKVSVQILDARGQLIAQHDAEPAGGSRPTDQWQAGEQIADNHAVPIAFGTPPGEYRLVVVVYAAETGERVQQASGDALPLGTVSVTRVDSAVPLAVLPMQYRTLTNLGPLTLAGYDLYRQGYRHVPETPLEPGDLLHVTLYWLAPDPLPANWPADQTFSLRLGDQLLTAPLAGGTYPTGEWAPGELVRGDFDVFFAGGDRRPQLLVGDDAIQLHAIPAR